MKKVTSLLLACISILALIGCGAASDIWQEQYDLAIKLFDEGNYEEAILAFDKAIEIDPKRVKAYVGKAEAYIARGDENAAEDVKAVLEMAYSQCDDKQVAKEFISLSDKLMAEGHEAWAMELLDYAYELTGDESILKHKEKLNGSKDDGDKTMEELLEEGFTGDVVGIEDVTFMGSSVHNLSVSAMKSLLFQAGYEDLYSDEESVSFCNEDASILIDGDPSFWEYAVDPGVRVAIGFCGINTGDTYETVLKKLGFENADVISGKIEEVTVQGYSGMEDEALFVLNDWMATIGEEEKTFEIDLAAEYGGTEQVPFYLEDMGFGIYCSEGGNETISVILYFENNCLIGAEFMR